jgi:hypothetical protein
VPPDGEAATAFCAWLCGALHAWERSLGKRPFYVRLGLCGLRVVQALPTQRTFAGETGSSNSHHPDA